MAQDFFEKYNRRFEDEYPVDCVTDEDAWYAFTDGAEGDYPGPGWDPEWFGF